MSDTYNGKNLVVESDIINDLKGLGIEQGMNVMVHSSMSKIGWVLGGAPVVISALRQVLGDSGTIVMPAATPDCADPTLWERQPVPGVWLERIRAHIPLFDLKTTQTTMGTISETFRTWPGTLRSNHPLSSVSANGPLAESIVSDHAIEFSEADGTPYQKVYDLNFHILLLGVAFNRCTMLHFAESRSPKRRTTTNRFPILENNDRKWIEVNDMAIDNSTHFPRLGRAFVGADYSIQKNVGDAYSFLFKAQDLVDFAIRYFNDNL